jgi:hypothetical protein
VSRLVVPSAASALFVILSIATIRLFRPRQPRTVFFAYASVLLVVSGALLASVWPLDSPDDAIAAAACVTLQLLACLTIWNLFYSVLWGFSGTMLYELLTSAELRNRDRLVRSYAGDGRIHRMLARRLPNLARGGWISIEERTLCVRPKGRVVAFCTRVTFRLFSLGKGGGV